MSSSGRVARPWQALSALAAVAALVLARSRPPAPVAADAHLETFSAERAFDTLVRLLGDSAPRPSGSPAHAGALERLEQELRRLGLEPEVHRAVVRRGDRLALVRDLVARVPGREPGPEHAGVLLMAHHDSVAAGPGAADDGAGVATLLETARALLHGEPPRRDVLLLFTDGEEDGLHGAHAFCLGHPWLARTGVVLNFEARGSGGPSMLFQTSGPNRWLLAAAARDLPRPWTSSVADLVYRTMPNDTDLSAFVEAGVPGVNFAFIDGLARYHTPRDDLEHLDRGSLQHHGDCALALARALAALELETEAGAVARGERVPRGQPVGQAVFFDLCGLAIVSWPAGWSLPLSLLALALGLAGLARAGALEPGGRAALARTAVRALLPACGALLAGALLGSFGPWLAARILGLPLLAHAHPWAPSVAAVAGVLLGLTLVAPRSTGAAGSIPGRQAPSGQLAALWAVWSLFALGALVAAAALPPVGYLALVPAGVAGTAALLLPRRPAVAQLAALVAAGLVWLPIVHGLRLGFGFALPLLVAAPLALLGLWAWPAFRGAGHGGTRGVRLASLAALVLGTVATVLLPAATPDHPGWLTLRYRQGPDGAAQLETEGGARALPPGLAELAHFEPRGGDAGGFVHRAPAPPPGAPLPLPTADLWPASGAPGGSLRVHLRPARPGSRLVLHFEAPVRVTGRLPEGLSGVGDDEQPLRALVVTGLDAGGVELELRTLDGAPMGPFLLGEETAGLPPAAAAFAAARPAELVPRSRGDTTTAWVRVVP